jgi:choline dehydrogenase
VLGGSSSINGMVWLRGHPRDFDRWAQMGARGWSHADVLPYFQRAETAPVDGPERGQGGPMRLTRPNAGAPLTKAFIDAGVQAGHAVAEDFNGPHPEGFGVFERSTHGGRRWSAARAYLSPEVRARPNLTIRTGAQALGITLDGRRASGVRYLMAGQPREATAEAGVILAAGAFGSPHLLQVSGIGPARTLEAAGIEVRHDLPGVGENLSDHPDIVLQWACRQPVTIYPVTRPPRSWIAGAEWWLRGTGPAATNHFEAGAFLKSRDGVEHPDIQFTLMPLAVVPGGTDVRQSHAFQVHIDLMRPLSRGHVRPRSADPLAAPAIRFNYLADPDDRATFRRSVALLREVIAQPAMAAYAGEELFPGPGTTGEELDAWIAATMETCYHPVGTCRMGAEDDSGAVVDPLCRVRGLDGLHVVDASIMPSIVSANTNAATIMIAERAADLLRGRSTPGRQPAAAPALAGAVG